jgi:hypothetical protein
MELGLPDMFLVSILLLFVLGKQDFFKMLPQNRKENALQSIHQNFRLQLLAVVLIHIKQEATLAPMATAPAVPPRTALAAANEDFLPVCET